MATDEAGLVVRVDGAGAEVPVPHGWRAVDTDASGLAGLLASVPEHRTIVIVPEASATAALPAPTPAPPVAGRVTLSEIETAAPPAADSAPASGWAAGLAALGATLDTDAWPALPEGLARIAPVRNVLESAGQIGRVTAEDGTKWVACGFPDLRRPSSKVLLVRDALPHGEVIALHRYPRRVGIVARGSGAWLPGDQAPGAVVEEVTGREAPVGGALFAVEPGQVHLSDGGRVQSWDGRRLSDSGTASQALASLVLRWSQR